MKSRSSLDLPYFSCLSIIVVYHIESMYNDAVMCDIVHVLENVYGLRIS